ncbi:DUF3889 domain-containing protein [Sediminibacillus albus]|uniref:DUF3889 domain-containing protein n=1 Tax=Sediminibacillus albus TaxID=407036 RepID=A0A1G8X0A7_9BACI|nr:DUF3889 domain-containing protein [Sediminibacillus albus]SDJ84088.1 Protein of unknown function [Sediminibacillus albus]
MLQGTFRNALMVFALLFMAFPASMLAQPEYAEWGRLALQETKNEYADYNATDYSYQGKVYISEQREQFNFEIKLQGAEPKEVRVYVLVNPETEQLIDIYFDEVE